MSEGVNGNVNGKGFVVDVIDANESNAKWVDREEVSVGVTNDETRSVAAVDLEEERKEEDLNVDVDVDVDDRNGHSHTGDYKGALDREGVRVERDSDNGIDSESESSDDEEKLGNVMEEDDDDDDVNEEEEDENESESENDDDDEEDDEEPVLKYEKFSTSMQEILEKDSASALAVSLKYIVSV